jgi:hypothetical protein
MGSPFWAGHRVPLGLDFSGMAMWRPELEIHQEEEPGRRGANKNAQQATLEFPDWSDLGPLTPSITYGPLILR